MLAPSFNSCHDLPSPYAFLSNYDIIFLCLFLLSSLSSPICVSQWSWGVQPALVCGQTAISLVVKGNRFPFLPAAVKFVHLLTSPGGLCVPSNFCFAICSGLSLHSYCGWCHNRCEFRCASVMLCLETDSLMLVTPTSSHDLSSSSS